MNWRERLDNLKAQARQSASDASKKLAAALDTGNTGNRTTPPPPPMPQSPATQDAASLAPPPQNSPPAVSKEDILRALRDITLGREDCVVRRYRNRSVDVPAFAVDIGDYLRCEIGDKAVVELVESDCWTFALGEHGAVVLKGSSDDLQLRVFVSPDPKALRADIAKVGARTGVVALGALGALTLLSGGAVLIAAAPAAFTAGLAMLMRKKASAEEVKVFERRIADHIEQNVLPRFTADTVPALPTQASLPPAMSTNDPLSSLQKLKELRAAELISEQEFEAKKSEILARM